MLRQLERHVDHEADYVTFRLDALRQRAQSSAETVNATTSLGAMPDIARLNAVVTGARSSSSGTPSGQ
jgi:hypothetical protein